MMSRRKGRTMTYTSKHRYTGDTDAAFAAIEATLLPNGFRIVEKGPRSLTVTGRGMQSTKQSPLRGATRLHIEHRGGHLHLEAYLGGVRFMTLFVCLFPVLLFVGLTFLIPLLSGQGLAGVDFRVLYGAAVWVVIGPVIAISIRKRTAHALEDLLANAVTLGSRS